jgi:hypothetical protein
MGPGVVRPDATVVVANMATGKHARRRQRGTAAAAASASRVVERERRV